jgi:HK97 family phage portal protein
MGLFSKKVEERSQFIVPSELLQDGSFADVAVTVDTSLRLSSVWACVRLLADTVSTLPLDVFRNGEEIDLPPLLATPAAGWSLTEWTYAAMVSLLLRGNAWGLITARSGPRLTPSQVELVNPDDIVAQVSPTGSVIYRYKGRAVDPGDLWHVRAYVYPGSPLGLSPISYAAETIGLGLATQRFGRQFFSEGASPSGVLSTGSTLTSDRAAQLKDAIKGVSTGKRDPLVIAGADAKWQPISINPEESQFVESRKLGVSEIARTFGVPPEMIGGEAGNSLTYANVESQGIHFAQYSILPWAIKLENAIGQLLPRGQSVKFNLDGLRRADTLSRYQAHQIALQSGFMTVDEVRALEDLAPLAPALSPAPLTAIEGGAS